MKYPRPFLFVLDAKPTEKNELYKTIAGAKAHVWVISDTKENAQLTVINYNEKIFWEITNFEYVLEIQEQQIHDLHTDELRLYQTALRFGISADYIAYPIQV